MLEDIDNPIWDSIQQKIETLIKADNTFYDDSNSSFGNNTNTVQKAIEKLKSNKQDSLIAGNNINLYGNAISVDGGVNKEYELGSLYIINDLIIKDDKIYKVNESFTASNWNADIIKCVLISTGGGNGASEAIDVSFDNTNTKLQQLAGYDFPKYKKTIADTINMVLSDGTNDYNASIVKQSDGSYRLKCSINNFIISDRDMGVFLTVKNINNLSNVYERLSFISQFFNVQTNYTTMESLDYINLSSDECIISSLNLNLKFVFVYSSYNKVLSLIIVNQDFTNITSSTYNITLNIKNRVLRQEDRNIFAFSDPFMGTQDIMDNYILSLSQNNSSIKLIGSYTLKQGAGLTIGFYSPIIENYFNVSNSVEWTNTTGITSSNGKALKFGFYKNSSAGTDKPLYLLFLMHQDDTDLQVGEKITFNLTPDKNSTLDPIYQNVTNVQQAIESLSSRIPLFFDVYPEDNGTFDDAKRPANYFKKAYGITTVWKKRFGNTGAFTRYQGGNSNEGRSGLIQDYAMKKVTGRIGQMYAVTITTETGALYYGNKNAKIGMMTTSKASYADIQFDNSRAGKTSEKETRSINLLKETWELVSINNINIQDLLKS